MARRLFVELGLACTGETLWQQEGRIQGNADLPMSSAGRAAVAAAVPQLAGRKVISVHHPSDEAATETAQLFAEVVSARTRAWPDLADPDCGLLEGMRSADFEERYPRRRKQWKSDPLNLLPPEGEPFLDARDRVFAVISRLLRKNKGSALLVVLHPIALGFLRCWLEQRPENEAAALLADGPQIAWYTVATDLIDQLEAVDSDA